MSIAQRLALVQQRLEAAAKRAQRNVADITLVAVTKTHPLPTVIEAYQAGLRHFGENRVPEGNDKAVALARWLTENRQTTAAGWHFIGHLQSRQVGLVMAGGYSLIHSVDSLKLAERLERLALRDDNAPLGVLLQCNVSGEASKSGFALHRWQKDSRQLASFLAAATAISNMERVTIKGLMTMAPFAPDPEQSRPAFKSLAALQDIVRHELPHLTWQHLSMGMTDDFEVAIEEGATLIRVGRAIFGERN